MWLPSWLLFLSTIIRGITSNTKDDEPVLYYYGLEESERGLPACESRQACSAFLQRAWLPPALVRLCRCERRIRCDTRPTPDSIVSLDNSAYFQFCHPIDNLPKCTSGYLPLFVETSHERMDPVELEQLHHKNIRLTPPKIIYNCRCVEPFYWKLHEETTRISTYTCGSLPLCKSGEYCGNVNDSLYALYQTCLCPRNHKCTHRGGLPDLDVSELLYRGKGWRAYCIRMTDDYSYEDY